MRYKTIHVENTIQSHIDLSQVYGLDPVQMAMACVKRKSFLTSHITGANSMEQLRINIAGSELKLREQVLEEIEQIQRL